jgi:hypothetical protein
MMIKSTKTHSVSFIPEYLHNRLDQCQMANNGHTSRALFLYIWSALQSLLSLFPNTFSRSHLGSNVVVPKMMIIISLHQRDDVMDTCVTINSRLELNPGTKLALMKSLPSSSSVGWSLTLLWSYGKMFVNLFFGLFTGKSAAAHS